jgi:hypothetical protein
MGGNGCILCVSGLGSKYWLALPLQVFGLFCWMTWQEANGSWNELTLDKWISPLQGSASVSAPWGKCGIILPVRGSSPFSGPSPSAAETPTQSISLCPSSPSCWHTTAALPWSLMADGGRHCSRGIPPAATDQVRIGSQIGGNPALPPLCSTGCWVRHLGYKPNISHNACSG